jgi:hypothetical protein
MVFNGSLVGGARAHRSCKGGRLARAEAWRASSAATKVEEGAEGNNGYLLEVQLVAL